MTGQEEVRGQETGGGEGTGGEDRRDLCHPGVTDTYLTTRAEGDIVRRHLSCPEPEGGQAP